MSAGQWMQIDTCLLVMHFNSATVKDPVREPPPSDYAEGVLRDGLSEYCTIGFW
jgi:hypothetical protein